MGRPETIAIKPFSAFFTASHAGDQILGEKVAGFLFQWQPLVKLFSLGSRPHTTKIGRGHNGYQ
jgi:hypothetical protein